MQKFTGYDESKAVRSAHRATELEQRQRVLALRRAGFEPAELQRQPRISAAVAHAAMNRPVAINDRRVC